MTFRRERRRLARRLLLGQMLVILVGAATLWLVVFVLAPPIFHEHVRRAVGPVSDVVAHHLDQALSTTMLLALSIGVVVAAGAAAGISWLLATRIARPVEHLSRTADAIASGDLTARAPRPVADDELARLADAFNEMAGALEHTEVTRRRLLTDLAHELRTPLATIEAYHEGLVDGVVEPDGDTMATLREATARLQRLVEDVALVSRAEEGQLELDVRPVDVGALVRSVLDAIEPVAGTAGVTLEAEVPEATVGVAGDRDRLGQALTNLVANAIEHTPAGGRVGVTIRAHPDRVEVAVLDTGAGIAAEHLPHLFQRFYRADPARRRVGGSGVGLTITRAIVQAHGGEVTAASDGPGTGATFVMSLPRHRAGSAG